MINSYSNIQYTEKSFYHKKTLPLLYIPEMQDTCVTDADCDEFPETTCRPEPINVGLDPGTRRLPYSQWKEGDTLLKSCWCKEGRVRIPESRGCYDPIRKARSLMYYFRKSFLRLK
jgi:hypothetical protein